MEASAFNSSLKYQAWVLHHEFQAKSENFQGVREKTIACLKVDITLINLYFSYTLQRRQTWCPGMANPLPLLRPNKTPLELASNIPEETLPLSSPENNTTQSSHSPDEDMRQSDADASPQESVSSVESEGLSCFLFILLLKGSVHVW